MWKNDPDKPKTNTNWKSEEREKDSSPNYDRQSRLPHLLHDCSKQVHMASCKNKQANMDKKTQVNII